MSGGSDQDLFENREYWGTKLMPSLKTHLVKAIVVFWAIESILFRILQKIDLSGLNKFLDQIQYRYGYDFMPLKTP